MNYLLFHIEKIINMLNTYSLSSFLIFQPDLEIVVSGRIPIAPARKWPLCLRQDSYIPSTKVASMFKAGYLYPQHESGLYV